MPTHAEVSQHHPTPLPGLLCLSLLCTASLWLCGCPGRSGPALTDSGLIPPVAEVRDIRVLVASGNGPVRFAVNGPYTIRTGGGTVIERPRQGGWTEVTAQGGLRLGGRLVDRQRAQIVPARGATFELSHRRDGKWTPAGRYAGRLTFLLRSGGRLLAVNTVDLDTYVAGVLTRELAPTPCTR